MTNERPGCLSAYAVLQMLGAGLFLWFGIAMLAESDLGTGLFGLVLATFQGALAIGLWRLRTWTWWVTVIMVSLGALGSLVSVAAGQFLRLAALPVQGYVLYWFGTHKHLFGADRASEIAAGTISSRESTARAAAGTMSVPSKSSSLSAETHS